MLPLYRRSTAHLSSNRTVSKKNLPHVDVILSRKLCHYLHIVTQHLTMVLAERSHKDLILSSDYNSVSACTKATITSENL
jgi:hypothetical protein